MIIGSRIIQEIESAGAEHAVARVQGAARADPRRRSTHELAAETAAAEDPARLGAAQAAVPEGLWSKCPSCDAVLYSTDLEKNLNVCPKCGHHNRIGARARLDALLDPEGRFEIGAEVLPVDSLKFKDARRYPDRLEEARGGRPARPTRWS